MFAKVMANLNVRAAGRGALELVLLAPETSKTLKTKRVLAAEAAWVVVPPIADHAVHQHVCVGCGRRLAWARACSAARAGRCRCRRRMTHSFIWVTLSGVAARGRAENPGDLGGDLRSHLRFFLSLTFSPALDTGTKSLLKFGF
jgi:hypothetical protein